VVLVVGDKVVLVVGDKVVLVVGDKVVLVVGDKVVVVVGAEVVVGETHGSSLVIVKLYPTTESSIAQTVVDINAPTVTLLSV
jgi:hypothetical protein